MPFDIFTMFIYIGSLQLRRGRRDDAPEKTPPVTFNWYDTYIWLHLRLVGGRRLRLAIFMWGRHYTAGRARLTWWAFQHLFWTDALSTLVSAGILSPVWHSSSEETNLTKSVSWKTSGLTGHSPHFSKPFFAQPTVAAWLYALHRRDATWKTVTDLPAFVRSHFSIAWF